MGRNDRSRHASRDTPPMQCYTAVIPEQGSARRSLASAVDLSASCRGPWLWRARVGPTWTSTVPAESSSHGPGRAEAGRRSQACSTSLVRDRSRSLRGPRASLRAASGPPRGRRDRLGGGAYRALRSRGRGRAPCSAPCLGPYDPPPAERGRRRSRHRRVLLQVARSG